MLWGKDIITECLFYDNISDSGMNLLEANFKKVHYNTNLSERINEKNGLKNELTIF